MGVGKNWVMGISVRINRGAGRTMKVKEMGGFVRFVCKGRVCRAVGVMKLVFAGVVVQDVVLHRPFKVCSLAVYIVELSEFHRIFAYIWVVTGAFSSA